MSLNQCLKEQILTIAVETNEIESNQESQDLFVEEAQKSDSGMEEEYLNNSTAGLSDTSDNEMDEIYVKKRTRGNKKMIIDDDDDEDEKKEEEQLPDVSLSEEDHRKETGSDPMPNTVEDDEDDEHANNRLFIDTHFEEENAEMTDKLDLKKNSDLFDAELSDEDRSAVPANTGDGSDEEDAGNLNSDISDGEKQSDSNDDEGFVENQLNPELLAKLKKLKGAAKKAKERTKYERKSKPSADQMLELYSGSQKLVRESRINLPYYEPETKSLNDFIERATRKRQEYAGLKRAKDIVKAQIIQDKLSVSILPCQPANLKSRKWASQDVAKNTQQTETSPSKDEDKEDDVITSSQGSTVCQQHSTSLFPALACPTEMSEDELPDIAERNWDFLPADDLTKNGPLDFKESAVGRTNGLTNETSLSQNTSGHGDLRGVEESPLSPTIGICSEINTFNFETKCDKKNVPSLEKNQSADLFLSADSVVIEKVESGVGSSCKGLLDEVSCTAETVLLTHSRTHPSTPKLSLSDENGIHSDTVKQRKKSLLERLQGVELPSIPHLSGSPSDVICLTEPSAETTPKNPGVLKLMNKLAEHSKPRTLKAAHKVNLSIITKEGEEGSKKELKLHSLTYDVDQEEGTLVDDTPGSKLLKLKQQLDVGMRQKRQEARQRRLQLYALENEEGFEGEKEEAEEELEEDMTESSSSGEEEEGEEEGELMEDFGNESADDKDYNPLIDNEAEEDSDEGEEDDKLSGRDDVNQDSNDICLHFDASDDESDDEDITVRKKRPSKVVVVDSDVESDNDADYNDVESVAPAQKLESHTEKDSLSDSGRDPLLGLWSCDEETTKETDSRDKFRRENSKSPEIYTFDPSQSQITNSGHQSDSSQFLTNGPVIDGDGFIERTQARLLKNASNCAISKLSSLVDSGSENLTPGNIFKDFGSQEASQVFTPGNIFQDFKTQPVSGEQKERDLGEEGHSLYSMSNFGKNSIISEGFQSKKDLKLSDRHSSNNTFSDEDERDVYDPFSVLSKKEDNKKSKERKKIIKPVLTDSEDGNNDSGASDDDVSPSEKENDHTDREGDTDIEDETSQPEKDFEFKGFKDKKKGIRKEFVDDEAELSGSEYESDEDVDLAEADDILEEEEGDKDLAGVSEEQLREEVGRVHMKRLQDDDDREIMFFKERYLQDGDLYSEGAGRMRNFRWKNSDNDSQHDMFNVSDDEQQEEDNDEQQWRKDRYEREKFLEDIDPDSNNENSQLLKLGHVFLKKKESFSSKENVPAPKLIMLPPEPLKPKLSKKGSFLSRKDDSLIKIAQVTKSLGGTAKNSKNFIFQSVDQAESQEVIAGKDVTAPPKRKAHSQSEQPAKKVKMTESPTIKPPKRRESIFNLLE